MAELELSKEERERLIRIIQQFSEDELDQEMGNMDAGFLLDRLIGPLGNTFYNMGLRDAGALFSRRAEDIADELYAMEKAVDTR